MLPQHYIGAYTLLKTSMWVALSALNKSHIHDVILGLDGNPGQANLVAAP